jgi:rhodanese-related sulfurtransferase
MIRTTIGVVVILAIAFVVQVYRGVPVPAEGQGNALVPVAKADEVLALIRAGKKVVFIDTREEEEWQEEHIPGAINLTLRDVSKLDPATLGNPDLVIAYCLRDFRGFEVARALREAGVQQSAILAEYGLRGWQSRGLPTVLAHQAIDNTANDALRTCALDPAKCMEKPQ